MSESKHNTCPLCGGHGEEPRGAHIDTIDDAPVTQEMAARITNLRQAIKRHEADRDASVADAARLDELRKIASLPPEVRGSAIRERIRELKTLDEPPHAKEPRLRHYLGCDCEACRSNPYLAPDERRTHR